MLNMLRTFLFAAALVCALTRPVNAQFINPTVVEFDPSPDHASVQEYRLTIRVAGQPAIVQTISLGKPPLGIDGKVHAQFRPGQLPFLAPGATYEATVSAVSTAGSTASAASNTFRFTAACPVSLEPPKYAVTPTGGLGSVNVLGAPGCIWTATSDAPWLTIRTTTGSVPGTLLFEATPNAANGALRQATIIIGDQSLTAAQAVPVPPVQVCTYALAAITLPIDAAPKITGAEFYAWDTASTGDRRALQRAISGRIMAAWYTVSAFAIDATVRPGSVQDLAVYFADFDGGSRTQRFDVLADDGTVLDTRTETAFRNGRWLVWRIRGHVTVRVTKVGGLNAVVSGVFLGQPTAAAGGAQVAFVGTDDVTAGDWKTVYGQQSYAIAGDPVWLSAAGGNGALAVKTQDGCGWTGSADGVSLDAVSGSGAGTVAFTLAPNLAAALRTVSVTIGGQTLQWTQAGVTGPPVAAPVKPRVIK